MSTRWKRLAAGFAFAAALGVAVVGAGAARRNDDNSEAHATVAKRVATGASPAAIPRPTGPTRVSPSPTRQVPSVVQVDPQTVCMVNDRAMGRPQIPVQVETQTYYGCCEMCKTRLAAEEAVRYAIDPVTGKRVDKAAAVIGERPDGSVVYFSSEESLGRFGQSATRP